MTQQPLGRGAIATIATAVLALAGCGGSDGDAKALEPEPGDAGGCPLTIEQVSAAFGAQANGGDNPAAPNSLACSFTFNLDGRSMVLTGVPLDQSPLRRLERNDRQSGAKVVPVTALGSDAYAYTKADPTSEAGLAYTAGATFPAGSQDKHSVYKLAVLLPAEDPGYDLRALLAKLAALVQALDVDNPLVPNQRPIAYSK